MKNSPPKLKIYLGGPMFSYADVQNNLRLAQKLRKFNFDVYCPNENTEINDKSNGDITSEKIYLSDIERLNDCNIFFCQISEDSGTNWEAGYFDCLSKNVDSEKYIGCIGLATDIRLQTVPDPAKPSVDNQTMYINQFVVGGLKSSLGIFTDEDELIQKLIQIQKTK